MSIRPHWILYFLRVALLNLKHSLLLSVISTLTVAVSLILGGFFIFLTINVTSYLDSISEKLYITVYLDEAPSSDAVATLMEEIHDHEWVAEVAYRSKAENLEELLSLIPADTLQGLDEGHIPVQPSIEVRLKERHVTSKEITAISSWLAQLDDKYVDHVDEMLFGADKFRLMAAITDTFEVAGASISLIVVIAGLFFIFSTIKISLFARRDEVEILRLVGATSSFIRIPFFIEGIIQGILGALIAIIAVWLLDSRLSAFMIEEHHLNVSLNLLPSGLVTWFVIGGGMLGLVGSWLSIGRYLRR